MVNTKKYSSKCHTPGLEECPHPVVVDAPGDDRATVRLGGVIGADADGVNVSSLVGLDPQLLDDLVDLVHLLTVEAHDGSVQGTMILAQVTACQLRRLTIKKYRDDLGSSLQMQLVGERKMLKKGLMYTCNLSCLQKVHQDTNQCLELFIP